MLHKANLSLMKSNRPLVPFRTLSKDLERIVTPSNSEERRMIAAIQAVEKSVYAHADEIRYMDLKYLLTRGSSQDRIQVMPAPESDNWNNKPTNLPDRLKGLLAWYSRLLTKVYLKIEHASVNQIEPKDWKIVPSVDIIKHNPLYREL